LRGCCVGICEGGRTLILCWGITGGSRRGVGRGDGREGGPGCAVAAGERAVLVDESAGRGAGFVFGTFRESLATREGVLIGGAGGRAC
jgi:hypothetical protein